MSNWKLVRLNFGRNPTHFGETGIGIEQVSERVRSDTLFSAWMTAYARLIERPSIKDFLDDFPTSGQNCSNQAPSFSISSTFVYREKDGMLIYYLPRPIKLPGNYPAGKDDLPFSKTFRKLKYLPLTIWRDWYQADGFLECDRTQLIAKTQNKEEDFKGLGLDVAGTFDYDQSFQKQINPKVAIDRTTRATNFYHTGFTQFRWDEGDRSGLYFLLNMPSADHALETRLEACLRFLGEEGLGGERSSGAGRFNVEYWGNLPPEWEGIINFQQGNHYSLISLFWDSSITADWLGESAQYTLQERGGWIASPFSGRQLRRQMIRMFSEGSVFPQEPQGQLADVTPPEFIREDGTRIPHPFYRNGIAVSLPVKLRENTA
ncbi:MAG: type III-A CRISPR-associated RAMP protein Csm4 [Leptolyngbyaceae cyanobacterium]